MFGVFRAAGVCGRVRSWPRLDRSLHGVKVGGRAVKGRFLVGVGVGAALGMVVASGYKGMATEALEEPVVGVVPEVVVEKNTGFSVPKHVEGLTLVATSARKVTLFKFVTYAFGLYVHPSTMEQFTQDPEQNLQLILSDQQTKLIRIIPYRQIDNKHFLSGFVNGLTAVWNKEKVPKDTQKELTAKFGKVFESNKNFPVGSQIDFVWEKPNTSEAIMKVKMNGIIIGTITDPETCYGLFGLYLINSDRTKEVYEDVKIALSQKK